MISSHFCSFILKTSLNGEYVKYVHFSIVKLLIICLFISVELKHIVHKRLKYTPGLHGT